MESPLRDRSILVVTRDKCAGVQIALLFERAGANVVIADTIWEALELADVPVWSAAIVNQACCGADVSVICERLRASGVPIITYAGQDHRHAGIARGTSVPEPMRKPMDEVVDLLLAS